MGTKVKALVWEECRVGGMIAALCLAIGLLILLEFRLMPGSSLWGQDPSFFLSMVLAVPLLTSLMLILHPDYSGHLVGGFSMRVLRLPVPASVAVAVALAARTTFIFFVALLMITASKGMFEDGPGLGTVLLITLFYVFAQVLDWLRAPLSGLSSLLLLFLAGAAILLLGRGGALLDAVLSPSWLLPAQSTVAAVAVVSVAAFAYGVSVLAVHAARVGWCVGIPELWEWPKRVSFAWPSRKRPFSSPVAAQIWFELRRPGWSLLGLTLVISLVAAGAAWLSMGQWDSWRGHRLSRMWSFRQTASIIPFVALLLAAAVQGARTRIVGFRPTTGIAGYEYLHPLTTAQFALARMLSNALVLVPAIGVVLVLQFVLAGAMLLIVIPEALEMGATSPREVAWILLSRGLLAGLLAWPLLVIGTRLFRNVLLAVGAFLILVVVGWPFYKDVSQEMAVAASRIWAIPLLLFPIGLTVGAYTHAWKKGLMPFRLVAAWGVVWVLAAWIICHTVDFAWAGRYLTGPAYLSVFIIAPGWATLVVLPYVAVLLDVDWRRHSAKPPQDASQHERASSVLVTGKARVLAGIGAGLAVIMILWLCWPSVSAGKVLWRSRGYPVTVADLDAWHPAVSSQENLALKYTAAAHDRNYRAEEFFRGYMQPEGFIGINERLLFVGQAELVGEGPIWDEAWITSEAYWNQVTSHIAPVLKELSEDGPRASRYPIDLTLGHFVDSKHLTGLRMLSRELHLDALHWAVAGESGRATEAVVALLPLANSLSNEPILFSQRVRTAILSRAAWAVETVMNRCTLSEDDLLRLQQSLARALPATDSEMIMGRAIIRESVLALDDIASPQILRNRFRPPSAGLVALQPLWELYNPSAVEEMVLFIFFDDLLAVRAGPWSDLRRWQDRSNWSARDVALQFLTPFWSLRHFGFAYESEYRTRTQLDLACVALAVARYRASRGQLPENLSALVPAFLSAVPKDYFSDGRTPIRYEYGDDGNYVVYSVGRDGEDDGGNYRYSDAANKWHDGGDITFTVAPAPIIQSSLR